MADPDTPNATDLYRRVLADVKEAGITDQQQAEELADAISVDLLEDLRVREDGNSPEGEAPSADAVDRLQAIAAELGEERERLEWAATQVAHLADQRRKPSIDPDPTPEEVLPLTGSPEEEEASASGTEIGLPTDGDSPTTELRADPTTLGSDGAGGPEGTADGEAPADPGAAMSLAEDTKVGEGIEHPQAGGDEGSPDKEDSDPANPIPERLPIRRLHRPGRTRVLSILLCLLVFVVALVMMLSGGAT